MDGGEAAQIGDLGTSVCGKVREKDSFDDTNFTVTVTVLIQLHQHDTNFTLLQCTYGTGSFETYEDLQC